MLPSLVLIALVLSAAAAGRYGRPATPALAAAAIAWLFANKRVEGPVLWTLNADHGLVAADLVSLAALALALGIALFPPDR